MNMFTDWSSRRRLIVIAIVVGFISLVSISAYFIFRPARTCFDGKENQGEKGIDCGGQCTLQCRSQKQPLNTLWTKSFKMSNGLYDVAALVENPNLDAAVYNFKYKVELFDDAGRAILSTPFETFANAGDHFLLFSGGLNTNGVNVASTKLTIDDSYSLMKSTVPKNKKISVVSYNLISPDNKPRLVADIQNETTETFSNLPVTVMISDKNGPVAVSQTFVENLGPREKKTVTYTWPEALKYEADTEKCEKPIDVILVMDRSGSMRSDGSNPDEPMTAAKNAARSFVSKLKENDRVGYVSFATKVDDEIDQKLTSEPKTVDTSIGATEIRTDGEQYTNIADALKAAYGELISERIRGEAKQTIVFLTDGEPTYPKNPDNIRDNSYPGIMASEEAKKLKESGIELYIIGLGNEVKSEYLSTLATYPEYYYPAGRGEELFSIYNQIGKSICKKPPSVVEIIPRVNETGEI